MTSRRAAWIGAVIVASLLAATPLLRPLWRERTLRAAPRPLDVVLVTLDTVRADRLGCYGREGGTSPHLDSLARRGVLFRRAYAHVPLTAPSHSSLLTGLLPSRHGVHDNGGYVLKDEFATLAEQLVEAGYRTGAFVSAFVLDRRFGLARGFATYEDEVGGGPEQTLAEVKGEVTVGRALAWLRSPDPRPSFAWVHLYDPHHPYEPPEPFATRFKGQPYEGEIAYTDAQVGRLLEAVATRGRPALVAVVGDHGESLGEHQELTHSYFIYGGTQRVPLILSLPGWIPEGTVVEPVVRAVDLMPTILEIAGVRVPEGLDGQSLAPLMTGRSRREPGPAYLESYHPRLWWGARELLGLRTGRWLFIRSPRPELYDVDEDPGETVNLAAAHPDELARLAARLDGLKGASDPLQGRSAADPETAGRLRALGYVSGAAPVVADTGPEGLPDAKDNAPLLSHYTRAEDLAASGDHAGALEAYRSALKINPRSVTVRLSVANTLLTLGRFTDALPAFAQLSLEHPEEPAYIQGMARCLVGDRRPREALALLEPAVAKLADAASLREELAGLLLEYGRPQEAEKHLRAVVEQEPRQVRPRLKLAETLVRLGRRREAAELHYGLGRLYAEGGRRADAEREYRRSIELEPGRRDARMALGTLLEASGARP